MYVKINECVELLASIQSTHAKWDQFQGHWPLTSLSTTAYTQDAGFQMPISKVILNLFTRHLVTVVKQMASSSSSSITCEINWHTSVTLNLHTTDIHLASRLWYEKIYTTMSKAYIVVFSKGYNTLQIDIILLMIPRLNAATVGWVAPYVNQFLSTHCKKYIHMWTFLGVDLQ